MDARRVEIGVTGTACFRKACSTGTSPRVVLMGVDPGFRLRKMGATALLDGFKTRLQKSGVDGASV